MLCKGNTSDKFRAIFEFLQVINAETDSVEDMVSITDLLILFHSSLSLILSSCTLMDDKDRSRTAYNYSKRACENIMSMYKPERILCQTYSSHEVKECIPIDCFQEWFSKYGSQYSVWLEFIDLHSTIRVLTAEDNNDEVQSAVISTVPIPPSVTGTVDSCGQNNVFDFVLSGVNEKLTITEGDVKVVQFLSERSRLYELTCDEVLPIFKKYSISGALTLNAYKNVLAELDVYSNLSVEEMAVCESYFGVIYELYDKHGIRSVDVKEIFPGFSLLLKGCKSDKLIEGFLLNDSDNDNYISRREMWKLLRSYLTMLFALNREKGEKSIAEKTSTIDSISIEITAEMFNAISNDTNSSAISFEQFAGWYNTIGNKIIPWIELLDLSKWPEATVQTERSYDDEEEEEVNNYAVTFPLNESKETIIIDEPSVRLLRQILSLTDFSKVSCDELFAALIQNSNQGLITLNSYHNVLEPLITCNDDNFSFISTILDKIYDLFDYEHSKTADVLEIASALSIFCDGSKSDKLCSLFKFFDKTHRQELSMSRLDGFLEALLATIGLLTRSDIERSIKITVTSSIENLMKYHSLRGNDSVINLEQFGAWYNNGGSDNIPWLELMNPRKWPLELLNQTEEEEEGEGEDTQITQVFHFQLQPASSTITIGKEEVRDLEYVLSKTQLHLYPVKHIEDVLSIDESIIDIETFDSLIPSLVPRGDYDGSREILFHIFEFLKSTSKGYVAVNDLICSLSMFTGSCKTDKLSLCFNLYANEDGINERDFIHFISSYILMLLYFHDPRSIDLMHDVSTHVVYIAEQIFKLIDGPNKVITFQQFALWYNNNGNKLMPWLELLDLKKWPNIEIILPNREYASVKPIVTPNYTFTLTSADDKLYITNNDIDNLTRLLLDTKLYTYRSEDLQDKICRCSGDRNISKDEYLFYLPEICIQLPDAPSRKKEILSLLTRVYQMFDRNDNDIISIFELASGFSLFAMGNKSEKLSNAFDLFIPDENNAITYSSLYHYIYSFIATLLAVSEIYSENNVRTIRGIADTVAKEISDSIYSVHNLSRTDSVTFYQFAQWYSVRGTSEAPWIELLDLKKWPLRIEDMIDEEERGDGDSSDDKSIPPAPQSNQQQQLLPSIPDSTILLTCSTQDRYNQKYYVKISSEDAKAHELLLTESGINENSVEDVRGYFQHILGDKDIVTLDEFTEIIEGLVPESKGDYLLGTMFQLFKLLAGNAEEIQRCIIETAVLPLVKGKKTNKLIYANTIFSNGEMILSDEMFSTFLASLLAGILVCKAQPPSFREIIDICNAVCDTINDDLNHPYDSEIDFEDFANWYGEKGHLVIPWIELLDTTKWPRYAEDKPEDNAYSSNNYETTDTQTDKRITQMDMQGDYSDDEDEDSFVLNNTYELKISKTDCEYVRNLLDMSKLYNYNPRHIHDTFLGFSNDGLITKEQFDQAIKSLIPQKNLSVREKAFIMNALSQLYYVFVGPDDKSVPIEYVSTAISLLTTGNKSTKLSEAFYLYTIKDKIAYDDLSQFLYSFLIAICMMDEDAASNCKIVIHCKQECDSIVQQIYQSKRIDKNYSITFEDFAKWYSEEGGDSVIPWIELLDLNKWPVQVLPQ